jgi:hypothetical protein
LFAFECVGLSSKPRCLKYSVKAQAPDQFYNSLSKSRSHCFKIWSIRRESTNNPLIFLPLAGRWNELSAVPSPGPGLLYTGHLAWCIFRWIVMALRSQTRLTSEGMHCASFSLVSLPHVPCHCPPIHRVCWPQVLGKCVSEWMALCSGVCFE